MLSIRRIGVQWLCASLAAVSLTAVAQHRDPAPLPDNVVQRIVAIGQVSQTANFARSLHQRLEALTATVDETADASQRQHLKSRRMELTTLKNQARAELAATRSRLAALNQPVRLKEHDEFVAQIEARFDRLDRDLAQTDVDDGGQRRDALRHLQSELQALHGDVTAADMVPRGPVPTFQPYEPLPTPVRPPSRQLPQYLAQREVGPLRYASLGDLPPVTPPEAASCGYTAADLAATPDAPQSPEIQALAAQLGYSPTNIFEYVANNIAFEPYYGSLKGTLATLQAKAGGPTDQASLLIALLRASNIPARYVRGQVQMLDSASDPSGGRVSRWIGAKTAVGATAILAQGDFGAGSLVSNGVQIVQFNHVWVEACVPYGRYRGVAVDNTGERWIPLDPSYKDQSYQPGLSNTQTFNYATYLAKRSNSPTSLPSEAYAQQVQAAVRVGDPNATAQDVPYQGTVNPLGLDLLPASLPFEIVKFTNWPGTSSPEIAQLPAAHRYAFYFGGLNLSSRYAMYLPDVALDRITLSFKGATTADQTALDTWRTDGNVASAMPCTTTINVVPNLMVEGVAQTLPTVTGPVALCSTANSLTMEIGLQELAAGVTTADPNNVGRINYAAYSNIGAANWHALEAYAFQGSNALIAQRAAKLTAAVNSTPNPDASVATLDATEGEFLHLSGLKYMRYISDANKTIGALDGGSGASGTHLGLTSSQMKVQYVFDLPYAVTRSGFLVDVAGGQSRNRDLSTGAFVYKTFLLSGYAGSAYESYLWQETAKLDAVSTVRGLQFANETGVGTVVANSSNWSTVRSQLNVYAGSSASDCHYNGVQYPRCAIDDTTSAGSVVSLINQGYTVTLPKSLIQYASDWKGIVYLGELNNGTSSHALFAINKYAGGWTAGVQTSLDTYLADLGIGYIPIAQAPTYMCYPSIGSVQDAAPVTLSTEKGPPLVSGGDPVNMLSGNMYHAETDLSIKGRGGLPIVFERSYNSQQPQDGPLGYGWTHSFNHFLKFYGVENGVAKVSWTAGTGGEKFFATASHSNGNVTVGATLSNASGVYVVFQRASDGSFTIREKNGLTYKFASATGPSGVPGSGTTPVYAQLLSITDRNGNALTLNYSGASCPGGRYVCSVTDAIGRSLTFTYSGSHITQIQDFTGRKYQYSYTGSDLISFKNPLAMAGSQNPVSYNYYTTTDGTALAHLMKQYTLPRGNGMRFEYYPNGRTARHTVVLTDGSLSPDEVNTFRYNDFRRETVQTNERGYDRHFFFDAFGNPLRIVEENGAEHVYTYDCTDPTQAVGSAACAHPYNRLSNTGPDGYQSQYQYEIQGNVTKVTPPRGSTAAVQYLDFTSFNQPRRIQDGNGHWTVLRYDANGNLTDAIKAVASYTPPSCASAECAIPPAAQILAWTVNGYDTAGNLTSSKRVRDFTGQIANNTPTSNTGPIAGFSYDTNKLNAIGVTRTGIQNSDTVPSSQSATLGYDSLGRLKSGIDVDWQATQFNYDDLDRIIQATDRLGNLRSNSFDANGNPTGQTLQAPVAGVPTLIDSASVRYDDADRKAAITDAGGFVTAFAYDPSGNVLSVTNPDAYSIGFDYDPDNRPQRAYDQEDHAASTSRDPSGRMRSITDPNGHTVTRTYWDASRDGRLKSITQPTITGNGSGPVLTGGRAVQYDWDANGNAVSVTEIPAPGSGQANRVTTTTYDELNRPTRSVGPVYTDAAYGAVCPVTIDRYDSLGRLWQVAAGRTSSPCTTPASDVVSTQATYAYDDFDRLIKTTDALGRAWTAHYDAHDNVDSATDAKSQTTQYTWGYGHQLMTRVEQGGRITTYGRNLLGQPTSVTHPEASYTYDYDTAHRLKRLTDKRGNKTLTYDWSPGGWLNGVTDSDGRITSYRYDPVGRLAQITAPNGDAAAFRFDAGGRLMEKILPNSVSSRYQYNEDDSLKQIVNRNTTSAILTQHDYAYDGVGNRYSQTEAIGGSAIGYAYGYDELKRLTQVANGTPAQQENYAYDPLGNRTTKSVGQTSPTVTAYNFDLANQLTEIHSGSLTGPLQATLSYDNNGNLQSDGTKNYTWDALDQLSQVTKGGTTVAYGYDADGRRVRKVTGGVTTQWLYDGANLYAEYGTGWTTPNAVYTFAGLDHPLMRALVTGGSSYGQASYYAQDGLGSVVGTSNNTDATTQTERFDAWGNKLAGTLPQSAQFGYTGREPDETGLIFYRARYYSPNIGRFISRDPIGLRGGINQTAYVGNNPINFVDPTGLYVASISQMGGGSIGAGIKGAPDTSNTSSYHTDDASTKIACFDPISATVCAQAISSGLGVGGAVGNQTLNGGKGAGTGDQMVDQGLGLGGSNSSPGSPDPMCGLLGIGCKKDDASGSDKTQEHHIATDKNVVSPNTGGPWTPRFQELFNKANVSMQDAANKVDVAAHTGPHSAEYHAAVYQRLSDVFSYGYDGERLSAAFRGELRAIGTELQTPGSDMWKLLMRK